MSAVTHSSREPKSPVAVAPHLRPVDAVLAALEVTPAGLTAAEAASRQQRHGLNALPESKARSVWSMIFEQFTDFLVLLLMVAAIVSGVMGELEDTIAIVVIVVLNAVIGVVQQYRAQKAMAALRQMAADQALVLRDGVAITVPAEQLTLGDVVVLDAGRKVPADLRLIEAAQLRIAEAALTGESTPVDKTIDALTDAELPVADRVNMAFRGTEVVYGRGVGVVTAIALDTELGHIANLLDRTGETKTPLQKRLATFGRTLGLAALALCAVVFVYGVLRGEPPLLMFLTAVSLAVAAVPEALPAVATVTLALGASRLVRTQVLVRKLPSVETLGSVTYICSDKTGTLTLNRMTVEHLAVNGDTLARLPPAPEATGVWRQLGLAMAISNDVSAGPAGSGDPTEVAFVSAARAAGLDPDALKHEFPRVAELAFDSDRKIMTTVHRAKDGSFVVFCKGAAEAVLSFSTSRWTKDGKAPLDARSLAAVVDAWASEGQRVLAFATRTLERLPENVDHASLEHDLELLGLVGLMDPPREEAMASVQTCLTAGITPVMVTGDHPATALAIAKRLGIARDASQMLSGVELAKLSPEAFKARVGQVRVYARVAPAQKLIIIEALQARGELVGMTGDGVNDAPALARADIGIAMGITGTDVAKEAGHMVLLDDNFASIVGAVREGRRIFDNIRKFIKYSLTSNAGEMWTILFAPVFGLPVPLLPLHILWVNLVTDGLPGLALSAEPHEAGVMQRPPRPPTQSLFADGLGWHLSWVGLLIGGVTLATQALATAWGMPWRTMAFSVLCLAQMGHALAIRSDRQSLFTQGLLSNVPLLGAVLFTLALQLGVIYLPVAQRLFDTHALSPKELGITFAMSSIVFIAVEIEKAFKRLRDRRASRPG